MPVNYLLYPNQLVGNPALLSVLLIGVCVLFVYALVNAMQRGICRLVEAVVRIPVSFLPEVISENIIPRNLLNLLFIKVCPDITGPLSDAGDKFDRAARAVLVGVTQVRKDYGTKNTDILSGLLNPHRDIYNNQSPANAEVISLKSFLHPLNIK